MGKTLDDVEVVIVGTGRAGSGLARAFAASEVPVALVSRTPRRVKRDEPPVFTTDHSRCPREVRFVILAVPDGVIPEVARSMLAARVIGPRSLVGHLSGALASSILTPPIPAERTFSAHPLTAFPKIMAVLEMTLSGVSVMIEAPHPKTLRAVEKLFRRADARVAILAPDRKPLYHAGAVVGSTFPFLNLMMSASILEACGVPDPSRVAGELLEDTIGNLVTSRDVSGLTGPFARGDVGTIASNLKALDAFSQEIAALYRLQGRIVTRWLGSSGRLSEETCEAIQKVLQT